MLYVIDFGLAKRFRNAKTGDHIPYRDGKSLTGTARYASVNTHLGVEQSRRDDIEGIGYVLMYFLKGKLPWMGIQAKTKDEKYDKIKDKKVSVTVEQLCRGYPKEFVKYFENCKNLGFEDKPDYSGYRRMFLDLLTAEGHTYDFVYDWLMKKSEREKLRGALKADTEEEKEPKMTKAEKFRLTQEKFKEKEDNLEDPHEEEKLVKNHKVKPASSKPKERSKIPTSKRKTFYGKAADKEEKKKNDIYAAMKDSGFGVSKPKIVTNNVRSYRF